MQTENTRIALAVTPQLLSDALAELLTYEGHDVIDLSKDNAPGHGQRFPVLLTSAPPEQGVSADVVIYLPESPELPRARISTGQWLPLEDMSGVIGFIRALLSDTSR